MSVGSELNQTMGIDVYRAQFEEVMDRVGKMGPKGKEALLSFCARAFSRPNAVTHQATRVSFCKTVVALLPRSTNLLERLLKRRKHRVDFEVHFSLFCWLDQVPWFPQLEGCRQTVLSWVTEYLAQIDREVASAAFMAADLLGDHWEWQESLPALVDVAQRGRYWVGRRWALYGLEKLREEADRQSFDKAVRPVLKRIRKLDRSQSVRTDAAQLYSKLYGKRS